MIDGGRQSIDCRAIDLVRKHIDGGRLSGSEREEIAQVLSDATAIIAEPTTMPQRAADELTQDQVLEYYQISRAKYFRWRQIGQSIPEGPDLPPFNDPKAMVAWYERMKGRGIFKHQCPKLLDRLAAHGLPSSKTAPAAESSTSTTTTSAGASLTVPGTMHASSISEEERGFLAELEHNEKKAVLERRAADEAFAKGDMQNYALLSAQYRETAEIVRKMSAQKESITLAEKSMTKTSYVVEMQTPIVKSVMKNLVFGTSVRRMYDTLGLEAKGISYDAFLAQHSQHVRECFADLVKNKLAEPFVLQAA